SRRPGTTADARRDPPPDRQPGRSRPVGVPVRGRKPRRTRRLHPCQPRSMATAATAALGGGRPSARPDRPGPVGRVTRGRGRSRPTSHLPRAVAVPTADGAKRRAPVSIRIGRARDVQFLRGGRAVSFPRLDPGLTALITPHLPVSLPATVP